MGTTHNCLRPTVLLRSRFYLMSEHSELDLAEALRNEVRAEKRLSKRLDDFAGEWVAVQDHKVVAHAPTLDKLMELIGDEAAEVFEVSAEEGAVCFF